MEKDHNEQVRDVLAKSSILSISVVLGSQYIAWDTAEGCILLCAQVSIHQTGDVRTLGSLDATLHFDQFAFPFSSFAVLTLRYIKYSLEHEYYAQCY
jgi:hypothetical protein